MKKGIIVLLIAVLISGFAFAGDFHGYADISFGVDLDEHTWGFANSTYGQYIFKFEFDSAKVSIGEDHQTDIWAELEAEASAFINLAPPKDNPYINLIPPAANSYTADLQPQYTAKITKANIHVGEITFGILNSGTAVDYAKSYYDDNRDGKADNDVVKGPKQLQSGFTVEYKGWYGGFGATGLWDENSSTYHVWGHGKTQSFELAEGLTAEAGGYAVLDSSDKYLGGGLKVDYAAEKLTAGIGGDGVLKKGNVDFGIEGSIYATYAFAEEGSVRLDIYGASRDYFDYYTEDDFILKLDAMLSAAYTFNLNDDIDLDVSGYVEARDSASRYLDLVIGATEGTTIDAITVKLSETVAFDNLANKDLDTEIGLTVEAYVEYAHEKFTAYGDLVADFTFDKDDATDTFAGLYFEAGISTDAIIEGATLSLVYGDNRQPFRATPYASWVDFLDLENHKGAITASCTIPF